MINIDDLTPEQREFIQKYQKIHARLSVLQEQMKSLQEQTSDMITELDELRKKENKIFKNGKK